MVLLALHPEDAWKQAGSEPNTDTQPDPPQLRRGIVRVSEPAVLSPWTQDPLVDAGIQFGDPLLHQVISRRCASSSKRTRREPLPSSAKTIDSNNGLSPLPVTLQREQGRLSHL